MLPYIPFMLPSETASTAASHYAKACSNSLTTKYQNDNY
ncbi:hypothetical protein DSUL_20440 [Desulfovibrionales bacterium]